MIRRFFPAVFVILLLFLQVFFHTLSGLAESLPDLIPIALTIVAVRGGMGWAALAGFLLGVVEDSFSTSHLGLNALAWTLAGTFGGAMRGSLYGNRVALAVVLTGILKLIHEVVYYVIYLWGSPRDIAVQLFLESSFAAIFSAGLALVFFLLLDRILLEAEE